MEQIRDVAITLRAVPYEERHRVITALTEQHGRISALARNSIQSRRFGGALDVFSAADWRFVERPGADLYRVEEAQIRRSFEGLRSDFGRLALASVLNELMLKVAPEREPCPELFKLHSNALAFLDEAHDAREELFVLNAYLAKILQWGGNQPQLTHCMVCRATLESLDLHQPITCIVADAGWICAGCRVQDTRHITGREGGHLRHALLRVTPSALRDFYSSLTAPIRQVPSLMRASRAEHLALFSFLEALFEFHIPGFNRESVKSLKFLDLELGLGG
jgi:DNA repair protein RecO